MHLSDRIQEFKDHVTIGEGFIDFEEIARIIRFKNPDFLLLMEVMTLHSGYKDINEFLSAAYGGAKRLCDKINNTH